MVGGSLCLDFANTVGSHSSDSPREDLLTYRDLLSWSRLAGILSKEEEKALAVMAQEKPGAAARALEKGRELREIIYRVFRSVAAGGSAADLDAFNVFLKRAMARARMVRAGEGFEIAFDPGGTLDGMLAPIAWSAAELLRGGEIGRVKACGNQTCGWLFVDRSKNRSRRWCEMSDCGNTAKARRFQQRRSRRPTTSAP